ncbi:anti-sigma factor [Microbacterium rhizomatis]|uniref:Regulator of SigK n=1 Tax=Microbacterium rhizomatis TaxID=1631477 RepID=A0A5J5IZP1_9MICO|nr:anti-sigma factor [Microbacterium rhizomatis]KAA9107557.1 anti-sigma factor [Microbacterium rhizomatis]
MNVNDFAELAAGHALGALSPEDESAYRTALREHPEWETIAEADAATAAALAETTLPVTPPASLRADLLARIAVTPQDGSAASQVGPLAAAVSDAADGGPEPPLDTAELQTVARRSWTRGIFALAASLVLLVALGFGAATIGQQLNRPASVVALSQIQDAPDAQASTVTLDGGGTATAHWSDSLGKAVLVSTGLPAIASDQAYELWFVRDGAPLSAGVVDAAPGGDVTALLTGEMHAGDIIAVTVEQAGGSPTGQPTSSPIVAIATA